MSGKHTLLILDKSSENYARLINRADLTGLEIHTANVAAKAEKWIVECDLILGAPKLIAPVLNSARRLQWLQSTWAGVDALVRPPLRTDYQLTGVKNIFGPHMSEYVFAYILVRERNIFEIHANQQRRVWDEVAYKPLVGKKIGICGLGSIGRDIARTAAHFGMTVWGYRQKDVSTGHVDRLFVGDRFYDFLSGPDYIVITLPLTDDTHYMFNERAFAAMQHTAVVINVGRGSVVDERNLIKALKNKAIGGAVLDVFEKEPLPEESPLWSLPNVIITPHISAYSFADEIVNIFIDNYRRYTAGQPLKYVIDFKKGY